MKSLIIQTFLICILILQSANASEHNNLETYIVHVDSLLFNDQSQDLESWYTSFLPTTLKSSNKNARMVYSYRNVFRGFSAKLTSEEVKEMEKKKGFLFASPEEIIQLQTTHTQNFLGLQKNRGFWRESSYGKGVIIGVLDSGIMPDHPSFGDKRMPPPPAKWKGKCEFNFTACNNKLIGARYFKKGNKTPFDEGGHGTHTAGTAAGNFVKGANFFGNANGTAVGTAPRAHLAIYKVCSPGCPESDILAALDAAIDDGVDVLSLSIGSSSRPFYRDNIAIGALRAIEKGIFVSCAAGNFGPSNSSLANEAPWLLTVGATTTDRNLRANVVLGNGIELEGESGFQPKDFSTSQLPLFYLPTNDSDPYCTPESFQNTNVEGKIVICFSGGKTSGVAKGQAVKDVGGAAMILLNSEPQGSTTAARAHVLPATNLDYDGAQKIKAYLRSTSKPTASIVFKGTKFGDKNAPTVAYFSSRGPNKVSPGILKPDIVGPGVNILAAWPFSLEDEASTKSTFNVVSGTSMSCPHLSGIAALLKSTHPEWSPAAIKSAIMTSAYNVNLNNLPIEDERHLPADIFATGAGHVNPSNANDPGLIYDNEPQDYIPYLCGLNFTDQQVSVIVQRKVNCALVSSILEAQLNYPSFSITFGQPTQTYTRTVTNVGEASESYTVDIVQPEGVDVVVNPRTLNFSRLNQKLAYKVTLTISGTGFKPAISQGYLLWKSSKHSVRSPIAVRHIDVLPSISFHESM